MTLTYDELRDAVGGDAAGVRIRAGLEPLGGPGDKVFPPTYAVADAAATRYAEEERRLPDGSIERAVVLDSVASQANRMELALLEAIRASDLSLPLTSVDFSAAGTIADLDRISELEAPHRIFDAILRDSLDGDVLFRLGSVGRSITEASGRRATQMFVHSPATLVFGGWDSTGPKGGRGSKYERAITSEITAKGAQTGVKTASRIDPLSIELKGSTVYEAADRAAGWTLDPEEAVKDKGVPRKIKPSESNHGNIAPSIDTRAGGVTAQSIDAVTVLSFIQLRRLGFPLDAGGQPFADRRAAELAARTALAAIGLAAAVLSLETGFDLRSRCVLVTKGDPAIELVGRNGAATTFALDGRSATSLVAEAAGAAAASGLAWRGEEHLLRPTDRLVRLIEDSRAAAAGPLATGD